MYLALAGFAALAVAMGIGRFAFTPLLPMMQADAGVTLAQGGWLASANYIGYLAGALLAAAMPVSASAAIRVGLATIAAATLAMSFHTGFAGWMVLRAIAGVASAWVLIHTSAWCMERLASPIHKASVFGGVGGGIAAAGVVCLALMMAQAGSAQAWIALGLAAAAATVLVWPVFSASQAALPKERRAARWTGEEWRLVLCYGVFGFGYIIPATFIPAMAKEAIEDPAVFGWAWPAFGAAALLSTLAAGALVERIGNRNLWILSHLVMALGVAAPLVLPGVGGIAVAALCVGGTFMVTTMAGMQEARSVAGAHAAGLMAAMTAAFAAGQIAGPLLVSALLVKGGDLSHSLLLASILLLLSGGALYIRRPRWSIACRP
jgi:predicted MFS family arabinose efflux permease